MNAKNLLARVRKARAALGELRRAAHALGPDDWIKGLDDSTEWADTQAERIEDGFTKKVDDAYSAFAERATQRETVTYQDYDALAREMAETYAATHPAEVIAEIDSVGVHIIEGLSRLTGISLPVQRLKAIEAAANFSPGWLLEYPDSLKGALRSVLADSFATPIQSADLVDRLESAYKGARLRDARSLINNSIVNIDRMIIRSIGDELGYELYWYRGPRDKANRPFCSAMVDRIYTFEMLDGCENGFDSSVLDDCGGINCRHRLYPMGILEAEKFPGKLVRGYSYEMAPISAGNPKTGTAPKFIRYIVPDN